MEYFFSREQILAMKTAGRALENKMDAAFIAGEEKQSELYFSLIMVLYAILTPSQYHSVKC